MFVEASNWISANAPLLIAVGSTAGLAIAGAAAFSKKRVVFKRKR